MRNRYARPRELAERHNAPSLAPFNVTSKNASRYWYSKVVDAMEAYSYKYIIYKIAVIYQEMHPLSTLILSRAVSALSSQVLDIERNDGSFDAFRVIHP